MTLGERLDNNNGIGPGFDHLRIGLAAGILLWHSFGACYGVAWIDTVPKFILACLSTLLPMFFGLSGFLVMGSAFRTHNVRIFITFRILRILPALFVEVMLSAIALGSCVTTLPLDQYLRNPEFYSYFGILIGAIRYWLPGVFTHNPINVTNGALWTVGPEILCYCFVSGMMLTGLFIRKLPMILAIIIFCVICLVADRWEMSWNFVHLPVKALILSFMAGNVLYLFRSEIPYSSMLFLVALGLSILCIVAGQYAETLRPCSYIAACLMPYCAAYLGLTRLPQMPYFHRGDYSYGVYIYGFPIQQALVFYFPQMRIWWFNYALSLPIAVAFATMSWHLIEKPVLSLRKRLLPDPATLANDEAQGAFTFRKFATLVVIVAYGTFIMNAARVFPLHAVYDDLTHHAHAKTRDTQQF